MLHPAPGWGLNPLPEPLQGQLAEGYRGAFCNKDDFTTGLVFVPRPAMAVGLVC
jgi:hypothetical protein